MDAKNKFDYERAAFENAFADKRDKRIVLYGTGRMTATLLERLEGFNIVGLLDKNAPFIESFLTAPNGMMECVNDDGTVRHSPDGENQRHFAVREEMAEGVLDFIRDAERVRQEAGIPRADISGWADGAFGTLMRGAFIPTPKMREGFYYDNGIAGRQETAIFG